MDRINVRIVNWEKYNPRGDVKRPTWFRLEYTIATSEALYDLTLEERWVLIPLFCFSIEKVTHGVISARLDWFADHYRIERAIVVRALEKLIANGTLQGLNEHVTPTLRTRDVDVTPACKDVTTQDGTLHYGTLQDTTGQEDHQETTFLGANDQVFEQPAKPVRKPKPTAAPPEASPPAPLPVPVVVEAKSRAPNLPWDTWCAYSAAYAQRYGIAPVKNKADLGKCKVLADKLGSEAPGVARFYVERDGWAAENGHPLQILVADAQKFRTEWVTGNKIERRTYAQRKSDANRDLWQKLEREEKEEKCQT